MPHRRRGVPVGSLCLGAAPKNHFQFAEVSRTSYRNGIPEISLPRPILSWQPLPGLFREMHITGDLPF